MERILIVDDDEGLVHFLKRFFARQEYEVNVCGSGRDAIRLVSREPFDLILMDYEMPGINGLDTLSEIRRLQVKTPNTHHRHDGLRDHGDGHRSDEARGLRLHPQTLRWKRASAGSPGRHGTPRDRQRAASAFIPTRP